MTPRRLELIGRGDCELCHDLLVMLEPYRQAGRIVIETSVPEDHPALAESIQWRLPVLLEGGRELMWGRVEAAEVEAALGEPPAC
jgi:hypothetical protein